MDNSNEKQPGASNTEGQRKDGKPYADGNVAADGSYKVGKDRPPEATRFAAGDGRSRGRRPKGTRNLQTDWDAELAEKMTLKENGQTRTISKQRSMIKAVVARAVRGSDRAAEIAFRHAARRDEAAPKLRHDDAEIIRLFLAQQHATEQGIVSDDWDVQPIDSSAGHEHDDDL